MDKYEELIAVFSETLKQSRDYHIAYMYQVGYVSVLGLYERDSTQNILRKKWRTVCCVIGAGNGFIRIESC